MDESQVKEILEELKSIRAQLRSMLEAVNSNALTMGQRVTSVESWMEGHEKQVALMVKQTDDRYEAHERLDEERHRTVREMLENMTTKLDGVRDSLLFQLNAFSARVGKIEMESLANKQAFDGVFEVVNGDHGLVAQVQKLKEQGAHNKVIISIVTAILIALAGGVIQHQFFGKG